MQINMLENVTCRHLCTSALSGDKTDFLSARIRDAYSLNWLVDGLPAAEMKRDEKTGEVFYSSGFSLGTAAPIMPKAKNEPHDVKDWRIEVNNHYQIYLEYHSRDGIHQRVVGALVWPTTCVLPRRSFDGRLTPLAQTGLPGRIIFNSAELRG